MNFEQNTSLQPFNTLAVPASARYFVAVRDEGELQDAIRFSNVRTLPRLILGGGSNIVLSDNFDGLVIYLCMKGIEAEAVPAGGMHVCVAAGENWDDLVRHTLAQGWYGLENLSAIPGNVGAAPIQNIGAYGVEISSVLHSVYGLDIDSMQFRQLSNSDCELSYRDSIFKQSLKDRFVITRVDLNLSTMPAPVLSYPALAQALGEREASPERVAEVVRQVRAEKLPTPSRVPNAGSFFKNPVVSEQTFSDLKADYPDMPGWATATGVKLAAGWLLEQAGWRGFEGDNGLAGLGMYQHQALVLINPGRCRGAQVLALAEKIKASVQARFGVQLEIEPRVY